MKLATGSATDTGLVRGNNEDTFLVDNEHVLYAVADGMGGHRGGEVASELSTKSLREQLVDTDTELSTDELVRAVQRANDAVVGAASQDPELAGMGTTLCALALVESQGDERLAPVS